jgi:hypothetical protein
VSLTEAPALHGQPSRSLRQTSSLHALKAAPSPRPTRESRHALRPLVVDVRWQLANGSSKGLFARFIVRVSLPPAAVEGHKALGIEPLREEARDGIVKVDVGAANVA